MPPETPSPRGGSTYATDQYVPVLVLLVAVLGLAMYVAESRVFRVIVGLALLLVVLGSMRATGTTPTRMRTALAMAGLWGVLVIAGGFTDTDGIVAGIGLGVAGALGFSAFALVRRIFEEPKIGIQQVLAAVAAYMQIALSFAFVFGATAELTDRAFFTNGISAQTGDFVYFSVVTISTLGYGDLAPATNFGRSIVVIETLLGQVFLVVLVAYLVGRLGRTQRSQDT